MRILLFVDSCIQRGNSKSHNNHRYFTGDITWSKESLAQLKTLLEMCRLAWSKRIFDDLQIQYLLRYPCIGQYQAHIRSQSSENEIISLSINKTVHLLHH